jgi:hypothetical protein
MNGLGAGHVRVRSLEPGLERAAGHVRVRSLEPGHVWPEGRTCPVKVSGIRLGGEYVWPDRSFWW